MRTIKFRGKRLDNGEWCYGYYNYCNNTHTIHWENENDAPWWADVAPGSVGQYTGLKDYDGREIYEGDIIEFGRFRTQMRVVYSREYVSFVGRMIGVPRPGNNTISCNVRVVVIGNIYDNPDLMKGNE